MEVGVGDPVVLGVPDVVTVGGTVLGGLAVRSGTGVGGTDVLVGLGVGGAAVGMGLGVFVAHGTPPGHPPGGGLMVGRRVEVRVGLGDRVIGGTGVTFVEQPYALFWVVRSGSGIDSMVTKS